jgi:hypothetical protein
MSGRTDELQAALKAAIDSGIREIACHESSTILAVCYVIWNSTPSNVETLLHVAGVTDYWGGGALPECQTDDEWCGLEQLWSPASLEVLGRDVVPRVEGLDAWLS